MFNKLFDRLNNWAEVLILASLLLWLALLCQGCTTLDPGVYARQRQAASAAYDAETEGSLSVQLNEQLIRERAGARHQRAMAEIQSGTAAASDGTDAIGPDGVAGGMPVIFINDAARTRTAIIEKVSGIDRGFSWKLTIPAGQFRRYALEVGSYQINWTVEEYRGSSSRLYGPENFVVSPEPRFYDDETRARYHGGYRFYGR